MSVPVDSPVVVDGPVALVLSDNFEEYIRYTDAGIDLAKSIIIVNETLVEGLNPGRYAQRLIAMVKTTFPGVQLANDLAEARAMGAKSVCLLDTVVNYGAMSGDKTRVEASIIVFDEKPVPISRFRGYGEKVIPYPAFGDVFGPAAESAVRELEAKLAAFVRKGG